MAVLGWLGCAAVLVAWAGTELSRRVWDYVNRTEVLAAFEDAETPSVLSAPTCSELIAAFDAAEFEMDDDELSDEEAHRAALVEMRLNTLRQVRDSDIHAWLDGWETA